MFMSNLQNRQNSKILAAFYIVCFALAVVLDSGFGSSNAKSNNAGYSYSCSGCNIYYGRF